MSWCTPTSGGAILQLRIVPRASRNEVKEDMGDALKIRLQAPPVEGKANRALVEFLSERLRLPARDIAILSGQLARGKRVQVSGLTADEVVRRLEA